MIKIYRNLIGILYNFYQNLYLYLSYLSDIKIMTDGKVINFYRFISYKINDKIFIEDHKLLYMILLFI